MRRKLAYQLLFEDTVANVKVNNNVFANANTHQWSEAWDVSEYGTAGVSIVNDSGSAYGLIASATMQPQILDYKTNTFVNFGNPISVTSAGFTDTGLTGLGVFWVPNWSGIVRFGISCLNTSTNDGYFDAALIMQN
jgi:hypothetical protein